MDDELEQKILKKVYAWLALAVVGLGSSAAVLGPSVIRSDPFTGQDGRFLKQEILFKCEQMEQRIRKDMPPENTRRRIRAIERHLEETSTFEVKEYHW